MTQFASAVKLRTFERSPKKLIKHFCSKLVILSGNDTISQEPSSANYADKSAGVITQIELL